MSRASLIQQIETLITSNNQKEVTASRVRTVLSAIVNYFYGSQETQVFTAEEKSKLEGVQAGAQVNPSAAAIKTLYESNADTNPFTDSDKSKLDQVNPAAQPNPSDAEIKAAYERNADTNPYTDAEKEKLAGVQTGAQVNPSAAAIKTLYESNANTNPYTDAEKLKLAGLSSNAPQSAELISLDTSTFSNNLDQSVDNTQKLAERVDQLTVAATAVGLGAMIERAEWTATENQNIFVVPNARTNEIYDPVSLYVDGVPKEFTGYMSVGVNKDSIYLAESLTAGTKVILIYVHADDQIGNVIDGDQDSDDYIIDGDID